MFEEFYHLLNHSVSIMFWFLERFNNPGENWCSVFVFVLLYHCIICIIE